MSKKTILIAIAALFTVNVWGQEVKLDLLNFNSGATRYIFGPGDTNPLRIRNSVNSYLALYGGTESGDGAYFAIYGKDAIEIGNEYNGQLSFVSNTQGLHSYAGLINFSQYDGTTWNKRYRIFKNGDHHWYTGTGGGTEKLTLLSNGNVGIGTTSPMYKLAVNGIIGNTWGSGGTLILYDDNSTRRNRAILGADEYGAYLRSTWNSGGTDAISFRNSNNAQVMTITNDDNIGIGTTDPGSFKLAVEGKIGAHEVVVTTEGWSDFVFEPNYNLMPIKEVESFVKENKHLPDVPSESEVMENGISLGEMDKILLQKIEELTLYVIELKKENEKLNQKVESILNK